MFMFLYGTNFNLYFLLLVRKFKLVFKDEEFWVYILMISVQSHAHNKHTSDLRKSQRFN